MSRYKRAMKASIYKVIKILLMTIMATGCVTVENNAMDEVKVPGCSEYAILFEIDWDSFESGTYSYGPEGSSIRRLGGGRSGYQMFFDLTLNFIFKDGREYNEQIDLRPLIDKMVKRYEIPDVRKTEWGGSGDLVVSLNANKLSIHYRVIEYEIKEDTKQIFHTINEYPVYEKILK